MKHLRIARQENAQTRLNIGRVGLLWPMILLLFLLTSCKKNRLSKEVVLEYYKNGQFNGSILIAKNDSVICDTTLGYSNFNTQTLVTNETAFYLASLSKPITAIAVMLLEQKGCLSYEDNASKYVRGLPDYVQDVTIQQLLTHTSGIKDYELPLSGRKGSTNSSIIMWLNKQKALQFRSGSKFEYSNTGYIILALIIEYVSGKSYSQFLQDNVFSPLNMTHTKVYDETRPSIFNKAVGFNKDKLLDDYSLLTTGDGGIYSTTEDLYKLDHALRNNTLLNRGQTMLMYKPPILSNGKESEYGLGWFIDNVGNNIIARHTGGLNGFRNLFWRDLKNGTTIIALTNQGDAFPLNNFLEDIKETFQKTRSVIPQ